MSVARLAKLNIEYNDLRDRLLAKETALANREMRISQLQGQLDELAGEITRNAPECWTDSDDVTTAVAYVRSLEDGTPAGHAPACNCFS